MNNPCGVRNSKATPSPFTPTAMTVPSKARKKICFPSPLHRGMWPPVPEIIDLSPGPGNGATYTCDSPLSSDVYATQRTSGDSRASVSLNFVTRNGTGFRSPAIGNTQRSLPVAADCVPKSRNRPSCDQFHGNLSTSLVKRICSVPAPPLDAF